MGIGGAGMSGLALLFNELGYRVSGCDMEHSSYSEKLAKVDIPVLVGHDPSHLDSFQVDLLAYSSAIPTNNPELAEAKRRGIPVLQRAELLSSLFDSKDGIGVAGTHGKTTTTSMISLILEQAGMDPTVAIGGELCDINCNAKIGRGPHMVAELDESDGSFEFFHPLYSVVTNVDWDHVNYYPSIASVKDAFARFLDNTKPEGRKILCLDDGGVQAILKKMTVQERRSVVTYGLNPEAYFSASDLEYLPGGGVRYSLHIDGSRIGTIELSVSGEHNVLDSLAACTAATLLKIPFEQMKQSLRSFRGAKRRLQFKARYGDILLYDDYGHHPMEIKATLKALKLMFPHRRTLLIFQPHRYSRTAALCDQFAKELSEASEVILLPIYAADEQQIQGVSSEMIYHRIQNLGKGHCCVVQDKAEAVERTLSLLKPGDLVLIEGAGDICVLGDMIIKELDHFILEATSTA